MKKTDGTEYRSEAAEYIRDAVNDALRKNGKSTKPNQTLRAFIETSNRFFEEAGITPIQLPNSVPEDIAEHIQQVFRMIGITDSAVTNAMQHSLEDAEWLSTHMQAMLETASTLSDKEQKTISYVQGHLSTKVLPEENEQPRLYRLRYVKDSLGNITKSTEQVDKIDINRKYLLCFGGYTNNHVNDVERNGLLRQVTEATGGVEHFIEEEIDLYTITLPVKHLTHYQAETFAYNNDPKHYSSDVMRRFVDTQLWPSLHPESTHINPETLSERMHGLNIFAFSYGGVNAKQLENLLAEKLLATGYDASVVKNVLSEAYSTYIGPTARFDVAKQRGEFSSLHVASPNDIVARGKVHYQSLFNQETPSVALRDHAMFVRSAVPKAAFRSPPKGGDLDMKNGRIGNQYVENEFSHRLNYYTTPRITLAVHDPHYIQAFVKYGLHEKDGALDVNEERLQPKAGERSGKFVAAAISRAAERSQHLHER